jgi:hypothetical protein
MENLRFSHNGWIVHVPNPIQDPMYDERGADPVDAVEFQGRRPILADDRSRHVYVGEPGWYHGDVAEHHQLGYAALNDHYQGYFGGGPKWGNGALKWYHGGPENNDHNDVLESLRETGFDIPDHPGKLDNGLQEHPKPVIDWTDDDDAFLPGIDIAS